MVLGQVGQLNIVSSSDQSVLGQHSDAETWGERPVPASHIPILARGGVPVGGKYQVAAAHLEGHVLPSSCCHYHAQEAPAEGLLSHGSFILLPRKDQEIEHLEVRTPKLKLLPQQDLPAVVSEVGCGPVFPWASVSQNDNRVSKDDSLDSPKSLC